MTKPPQQPVTQFRRKAFAIASAQVGPGEPAKQWLSDLSGQPDLSGKDAVFWSKLADQAQQQVYKQQYGEVGCTFKQWELILRLRGQLAMTDAHWYNFLKKHGKVDHPRFLTVAKARGLIAGLKKMLELQRLARISGP